MPESASLLIQQFLYMAPNPRHTYIHTYINTYIHTYIRTYIHACIHTYAGIKCPNLLVYSSDGFFQWYKILGLEPLSFTWSAAVTVGYMISRLLRILTISTKPPKSVFYIVYFLFCTYVYVYTRVYFYVQSPHFVLCVLCSVHMYLYIYQYTYIHSCICIHTYIHAYIYTCIYIYVCVCVCV
jgi:hypothetical protein